MAIKAEWLALALITVACMKTLRIYLADGHVTIMVLLYAILITMHVILELWTKEREGIYLTISSLTTYVSIATLLTGIRALEIIISIAIEKISALPLLPIHVSTYQPILLGIIGSLLYVIFYLGLPFAIFLFTSFSLNDDYREVIYGIIPDYRTE